MPTPTEARRQGCLVVVVVVVCLVLLLVLFIIPVIAT